MRPFTPHRRRRQRAAFATHWLVILTLLGNLLATNLAQAAIAAQRSPDQILVAICSSAGIRLVSLQAEAETAGTAIASRPAPLLVAAAASPAAPDTAFPNSARSDHSQGPGHCEACLGHLVSALPAGLSATAAPAADPAAKGIPNPTASHTDTRLRPDAMPRAPPAWRMVGTVLPARA